MMIAYSLLRQFCSLCHKTTHKINGSDLFGLSRKGFILQYSQLSLRIQFLQARKTDFSPWQWCLFAGVSKEARPPIQIKRTAKPIFGQQRGLKRYPCSEGCAYHLNQAFY